MLTLHIKVYLTTVIRHAPLPRKSFEIWRDSRGSCRGCLQKKSLTLLKCRCYLFCASVHERSERAPGPGVSVWIIIWKVRPKWEGGYCLVSFHLIRVLSRCWQIPDFDRLWRQLRMHLPRCCLYQCRVKCYFNAERHYVMATVWLTWSICTYLMTSTRVNTLTKQWLCLNQTLQN